MDAADASKSTQPQWQGSHGLVPSALLPCYVELLRGSQLLLGIVVVIGWGLRKFPLLDNHLSGHIVLV